MDPIVALKDLVKELQTCLSDGFGRIKVPSGFVTPFVEDEFDEVIHSMEDMGGEDGSFDISMEELMPTVLGDQGFHMGAQVMKWRFVDLATQFTGDPSTCRNASNKELVRILVANLKERGVSDNVVTYFKDGPHVHPITVRELAMIIALKIALGYDHQTPFTPMTEGIGGPRPQPLDYKERWHHQINLRHGCDYRADRDVPYDGRDEEVACFENPFTHESRTIMVKVGDMKRREMELNPLFMEIKSLPYHNGPRREGWAFCRPYFDEKTGVYEGPHLVEAFVKNGHTIVKKKSGLSKSMVHKEAMDIVKRCSKCKSTVCKCDEPGHTIVDHRLISGLFQRFMADRILTRNFMTPPHIMVWRNAFRRYDQRQAILKALPGWVKSSKGTKHFTKRKSTNALNFRARFFIPVPWPLLTQEAHPHLLGFKPNAIQVDTLPVWRDDPIWDMCWEFTDQWDRQGSFKIQ